VHDRPEHLADAHAQIEDAVAHWLHRCSPTLADDDVIALLQPTSPFRAPATVKRCVELVRAGCDSAVTVTMFSQNTGRTRGLYDDKWGDDIALRTLWDRPVSAPRPRSQDGEKKARENGVAWAFRVDHFRRTANRMGGREASVPTSELEALEVDYPHELELARVLSPHVGRLLAMEET
jgi:CMP-N-acetylneuraminic acid synthetase